MSSTRLPSRPVPARLRSPSVSPEPQAAPSSEMTTLQGSPSSTPEKKGLPKPTSGSSATTQTVSVTCQNINNMQTQLNNISARLVVIEQMLSSINTTLKTVVPSMPRTVTTARAHPATFERANI